MTKGNYIRLDALCGCGSPVKLWSGRGRKTTRCDECSTGRMSFDREGKCQQCGDRFERKKPDHLFCSRRCYERNKYGYAARQTYPLRCVECSADYESIDPKSMYCGQRCKQRHIRRRSDPLYGMRRAINSQLAAERAEERKRERLRRKLISTLKKGLKLLSSQEERPCGNCGEGYIRRKGQRNNLCLSCSDDAKRERIREDRRKGRKSPSGRAAKAKYKAKRRAREGISAIPVDPIAILDRDGWRCQLCGIKTPKSKRGGLHDNSPEVDHIISLADGGDHAPYNLQCACRKCNISKGADSRGSFCWLKSRGAPCCGKKATTESTAPQLTRKLFPVNRILLKD